MKKGMFLMLLLAAAPSAFAKQSLQAAMVQSPKLAALVAAVKEAAGVDCEIIDSFQSQSVRGPEGKTAITQQAACYDPQVFNPVQLGQLEVTYYGDGVQPNSTVGAVVDIDFEVFK